MSLEVNPVYQAPRKSRITTSPQRSCLLGAGCALTLLCQLICAEEQPRIATALASAPVLTYASITTSARHEAVDFIQSQPRTETKPSLTVRPHSDFTTGMTLANEKSTFVVIDDELLVDEDHGAEVFSRQIEARGLLAEGSIVLFRRQMGTRFSYRSSALLHSGYGQLFTTPDTIGRSRTNGAGIDDPCFVYLKLSLAF
jgi:hypothetical protein